MVSSNDSETLSELLEQRVLLLSLNAFGQPANLPFALTHNTHTKAEGGMGEIKLGGGVTESLGSVWEVEVMNCLHSPLVNPAL